jgi:hypothetical protein
MGAIFISILFALFLIVRLFALELLFINLVIEKKKLKYIKILKKLKYSSIGLECDIKFTNLALKNFTKASVY